MDAPHFPRFSITSDDLARIPSDENRELIKSILAKNPQLDGWGEVLEYVQAHQIEIPLADLLGAMKGW